MTENTRHALQVNRELVDALPTSDVNQRASLVPKSLGDAFEFAKVLASGTFSIPSFLHGQPTDCLSILFISMRTGLDPFFLASQCYVVPSKTGEKRMSFMAQAVHAIVRTSGILEEEPDLKFTGEGENLTVTVTAKLRDGKTHSENYQIPPSNVRNSPLWTSQPRQQLGYYGIRSWCRLHAPEALGGIVAREEAGMIDVTPETAIGTRPTATSRVAAMLGGDEAEQEDRVVESESTGIVERAVPVERTETGKRAVLGERTVRGERAAIKERTAVGKRADKSERAGIPERAADLINQTTGEIRRGLEAQMPLNPPDESSEPGNSSAPTVLSEPGPAREPKPRSDHRSNEHDHDKRLANMMTYVTNNATTIDELAEMIIEDNLQRAVRSLPEEHRKRWYRFLQQTEDGMRDADDNAT